MASRLIRLWEAEREAYVGSRRPATPHGLCRLAAEMLRSDANRLERLKTSIGLPGGLAVMSSLLVDDIEDGRLHADIEQCDDPSRSNGHILWLIDLARYEFWVPDPAEPLAADYRSALLSDGRYHPSESGTYAHYVGADRFYALSVSSEAVMQWANQVWLRHREAFNMASRATGLADVYEGALSEVKKQAGGAGQTRVNSRMNRQTAHQVMSAVDTKPSSSFEGARLGLPLV